MAGLTSTFTFEPLLSRPRHDSLSLSSIDSKLFGGLRLYSPNPSNSLVFTTSSTQFGAISSRYGGGGGGFPRPSPGDYRRSRDSKPNVSDDDQALDISSIGSATVRLIDDKQNMVGVMTKNEAIQMAEAAELDLVILSPDAEPPVVKIMDYNKYKYELQKRKREQQKKTAASRMDLKELKMGYNIDVHDYSVRLRAAQKFLKDGDKVKAIVNLKGRENDFRSNAVELLRRFQNDVGELATEEAKNFNDRNMFIILVPNKAVAQKAQEVVPKKKEQKSEQVVQPPKSPAQSQLASELTKVGAILKAEEP